MPQPVPQHLKRKALHPADFSDTEALKRRIMQFQCRYNEAPQPFRWNYTRQDLAAHVQRLHEKDWLPSGKSLEN